MTQLALLILSGAAVGLVTSMDSKVWRMSPDDGRSGMSLWQHYDKVITRMQLDICRLIEEKAEIEACVEELIAIRDQARAVHATGCGTYNDKRTSVDRKKLSDLGLMVKESYKTIPSEFNGSEAEVDVKTTTGESL